MVSPSILESAGQILFNDNTVIPLHSQIRGSNGNSVAMTGARDLKRLGILSLHQAGMVWL